MSVSENLWSEDELLTQMEQMQDQIEDLEQERKTLKEELDVKNKLLEEQEQANLLEISQLQSALRQAQKKVQEQSEQIVMMNGADLILQGNEKLKRENVRLQQEKERSEKEAARVEEVCKRRLQKKDDDLREKYHKAEERETQAKKKEQQADELARNRQKLINQAVATAKDRISQENASRYSKLINELRHSFFVKEEALNRRVAQASLYAFGISVLFACRSGPYLQALVDTGAQIWRWIVWLWEMVCHIAEIGAGISGIIPLSFMSEIVGKVIYTVIILMICSVTLVLLLITTGWVQRQIKWHMHIWQILLWMSGIIVLSVCFDNCIYLFCPVNVIWVGILFWIVTCACYIGYSKRRSKKFV